MIEAAFRSQARACLELGSPFTARLLGLMADRLDRSTEVGRMLLDWPGDPRADALPLRIAAALHALVLARRDPGLVTAYPPRQMADDGRLWQLVAAAFERFDDMISSFVQSPPQTNEVARAAVLAAGFATVADVARLPLIILELGASAGLNLHWDAFAHDLGGVRLGPCDGLPRLAPAWTGPPPPSGPVTVLGRSGCDRNPIDRSSADQVLRLRAYIWADQAARLLRLDQAVATTAWSRLAVETADAADWAGRKLRVLAPDCVTVLLHSIVWQYLGRDRQDRIATAIRQASDLATPASRFAWLRMEPGSERAAGLRLTIWPGGRAVTLAEVDYHGRWIRWRHRAEALRRSFAKG